MMPLPPLLPVSDIHDRLQKIFPDGTANRNYVTREIAAKTVFVMLYIGAVEDAGCWLRPDQVTRWSSFAWFMSEPDHIVLFHRGTDAEPVRLSDLI